MPITAPPLDPEDFCGNWTRRSCFIWFNQPEDAEEFGLRLLSHRDSGLIDQSNAAVTRKRLAPFVDGGDVMLFDCSHWAVGTTHEVAVRVYKPGTTETTEAFNVLAELVEQIDDYPILDEQDYSDREYESALEGIRFALFGTDIDAKTLPEGWEYGVYDWLDTHASRELENHDDQGAFPASEKVVKAIRAAGLATC